MRATRKKAFTLVEILISVALSGLLLAAVATAVHGSLKNQAENTDIAAATQAARFTLDLITREIRTAAAVDEHADPTTLTIVPPEDGSGTQQIKYEHDAASGSLVRRVTVNGSTTSQTLFGGQEDVRVQSFHAIYELGQDWQGLSCAKSVTIRMEFKVRNQTLAVTASVAPRRNQLY